MPSGRESVSLSSQLSEAQRHPLLPPPKAIQETDICCWGHLVKIIEQAYRPHSSVEWHFACSMRAKGRHRAGTSAIQPPGTPLALLDELHEESSHRFLHALRLAEMTRGRPFSQLIILLVRRDGVAENFANGRATYYICEVVPNCICPLASGRD